MSHRFVRCPHCKLPHEASERVCPETGLALPLDARPPSKPVSTPRGARRRPAPPVAPPPPARPKDEVTSTNIGEKRELVGKTLSDRYHIKGMLGQGGMGTVYDAEHLGLGREVAVKVLSPSQAKKRVAVKRFQQEARAAGAIGHPNICEVYDLGILDDGSPFLVMEKLVGQTLSDRIAKEGGLPFEDVVEIVGQVLSGLVAAHEKGIVHRDIKPENIFLAKRVGCPPIIKLLDFGVSKMMPEFSTGEDQLDLTRTGMVMGTPYYMSPEQARGERNLDGRVDVYACGVVMYEAICGKRPFIAPNYNALLLSIINTNARPLHELRPTIPRELEAIIDRAMAKNRDLRYPSAGQFLAELMPRTTPRSARGRSAARPVDKPRPSPNEFADSTRVDRPGRTGSDPGVPSTPSPSGERGRLAAARPPTPSGDSIEIPIHVTTPIVEDDDAPTEIFRPLERRLGPQAPQAPQARGPQAPQAPSSSTDWDGDTIVEHPDVFGRMFDEANRAPEPRRDGDPARRSPARRR